MSGTTVGGTPGAGWFPDPAGSPTLRWWDGRDWTTNFIDPQSGTPVPDPSAPVTQAPTPDGDQPLSRRQLRDVQPVQPVQSMQEGQQSQQPQEIAPFAPLMADASGPAPWVAAPPPRVEDAVQLERPAYVPMARTQHPQVAVQEIHVGSTATVAVWFFALLPLVQVGLVLAVFLQFPSAVSDIVRAALLLGPIPLYLLFALVDNARLNRNGYAESPSPALALIPPLYLGIRLARLGARALGPFITWLLLQAGAVGVLLVLFPSIFSTLTAFGGVTTADDTPAPTVSAHVLTDAERAYQLTPAGMAATVKADFAGQGIAFTSVTCVPLPSTQDGQTTTCSGSLGPTSMIISVSVDNGFPTAAFDVTNALPG